MLKQAVYRGILLVLLMSTTALAEGEGEGLFSGNFGEAIWTVVAFVALLLVLRRYAWGALLEGLQSREQHIKSEIDTAEKARRKAESLLGEYRAQGEKILKSATEDAQRQSHQLMSQTRAEAQATKDQAQVDINYARSAAVDRVREQAVELVSQLTAEVLARTVTPADNQELIQEALGRLRDPGQGARE